MSQEIIEQQQPQDFVLQNNATTNGNGEAGVVAGYDGVQVIEINNTDAAGTCTVQLQGSYDGTNWYNLDYAQIDNTANQTQSVAAIAVAASAKHVFQVENYYYRLRAVISGATGFTTGGVTVTAHCVPE